MSSSQGPRNLLTCILFFCFQMSVRRTQCIKYAATAFQRTDYINNMAQSLLNNSSCSYLVTGFNAEKEVLEHGAITLDHHDKLD